MTEETPAIHPNIADMPMGHLMAFPHDLPLPKGWHQCDGRMITDEEAASFVWFMGQQFNDKVKLAQSPPQAAIAMFLRKHGFRAYKNRVILPDFRGKESEMTFGAEIKDIDVILAIKVGMN